MNFLRSIFQGASGEDARNRTSLHGQDVNAIICSAKQNAGFFISHSPFRISHFATLRNLLFFAFAWLSLSAAHAAPLISAQPTSQTSFVGGNVTLQVQVVPASGTTYQWQVKPGGTGTPENVSGPAYRNASTASLQITTADAALDANTYGCLIIDGTGSVASNFVPLKVFAAPLTPSPVVTLSNSTISASSPADISIQITGLVLGQTVRIERVLDFNGDSKPGAGEPLVQSFTVTDGVSPGDQDSASNGQITTSFSLASSPELGRTQGIYLIRITSPLGGFQPITNTLTVVQVAHPQSIIGTVKDSNNNSVARAIVAAVQNSVVVATAVANVSGSYTLNAPAGTYSVVPFKPGYTASESSQPIVVLASGVSSTGINPILTLATATISGRVLNASGSPVLPGVQITGLSSNGYTSILTSDADGNYIVPAVPGTWTITTSPASLTLLGYQSPATPHQATTSTGNVTALDLLFSPVSSATSYAAWKSTAGFSASEQANVAISGETVDTDRDGLPNLMEYALGGNPTLSDSATVGPMVNSTGSNLQISFRCDDSRADLTYTVESSSTLASGSWIDIAQSTGGGQVAPISGRSTVSDSGSGSRLVTVSVPLTVGGKLFLRVKVAK